MDQVVSAPTRVTDTNPLAPPPAEQLGVYSYAEPRIRLLVTAWEGMEVVNTDFRRRLRDIKVDVKGLRERQVLKSDETYIPVRMIDINIRREQPPFIQYLTQSRRTALFHDEGGYTSPEDITELETEFTRVSRYHRWEIPYLRCLDGAMLHGWDSLEVVLDTSAPGGFGLEHVGHENLIFPTDARNIQQCEMILRVYWCSILRLRQFVSKFGFNAERIDTLVRMLDSGNANVQTRSNTDSLVRVYKVMYKQDGIVWVAWYAKDADGWLKDPAPLDMGVKRQEAVEVPPVIDPMTGMLIPQPPQIVWKPVEETEYPYEILFYQESEKPDIAQHYGRAYLDEFKQEAACALWSSFVNGCNRSSNVYAAPRNATDTAGAAPKQLEQSFEHGRMFDSPVDFFNTPWPNPVMLEAIKALDTQNATETNQIAWAVNNRQDSRKTATEITAANEQTSQINSVTVMLFSTFVRGVCRKTWRITQSLALQGLIKFMRKPVGGGAADMGLPEELPQNNVEVIGRTFDVHSAADVDVVKNQEKLQKMGQLWPLIQTTPCASAWLIDMIKIALPEDWQRYAAIMQQGSLKNQAIQALGGIVKAATTTPSGELEDEYREFAPQLQQVAQQAQVAMESPA